MLYIKDYTCTYICMYIYKSLHKKHVSKLPRAIDFLKKETAEASKRSDRMIVSRDKNVK